MNSYTQEYNDAIRSADREMKGYLRFNNDGAKIITGETGLISFKVTQQIMEQERYCIGGAVSCRCEASFFNTGIPYGVSLANSYIDAYVGVKLSDTLTTIVPEQSVTLSGGSGLLVGADFDGIANGALLTVIVNGKDLSGLYSTTTNTVNADDGDATYTVDADGFFYGTADGVDLSGVYSVKVVAPDEEFKCMGRFYISEVSREKETTAVVGYDAVNYYLSGKYEPTVTKTSSGYLAKDILNDIVVQTGVQGGTAFTSSIFNFYVPEIVEATMRETWGWLMCCAYSSSRPGVNTFGSLGTLGNVAMRSYSLGEGSYTSYPAITDDQIYMDGLTLGDAFTINSLTTGTQDSPITLGSGVGINSPNPYITTAQATNIYNALQGTTYMPMTLHFRGDPCIWLFDSLKVTQNNTDYRCIAMRITSTFNGGFEQTIDCWGDSEAYYEMSYSPMEAKIQTNNTLIKDIAQAIETARGGVITQILDDDGKWTEMTIANNQDLQSATSVWRFNINGLAHSNRYSGGTYTFALDDQGRIVATLIQTGILQDALGKNYWNLDTGDFQIANGSIHITTSNQSQDLINLTWSNGGNSGENTLTPSGHTVWDYNASLNRTSSLTLNNGYLTARYYTGNFGTLQGVASVSGVGGFKLLDGNQTDRAALGLTGLTFYNASGTQTAEYPSGGLQVAYGAVITTNVSSGTDTAVASVTLAAGKWLVIGNVGFASNATGRRYVGITTSSTSTTSGAIARASGNAMSGGMTMFSLSQVVTLTAASTTYYLVCYQNSGGALTTGGNTLRAIKLP